MRLSRTSLVVAVQEQVWCDLPGEVAVIDLKSDIYYGVEEVGARIWHLLQAPTTVADITAAILREYDVGQAQCEADTLAFLAQLVDAGLAELR